MPAYYGKWEDMPQDTDDLADRIMEGYNEGLKVGRQEGAQEIVDVIDDWLKATYFSPKVERNTPYSKEILDLVRKLIHGLRHGDLAKIPEFKKRSV